MLQKPRPVLQDMPYNVKKTIADSSEDYSQTMALRSSTSTFRRIIRDPKAHVEKIEFRLCGYYNYLRIIDKDDWQQFIYWPHDRGCLVRRSWSSLNRHHFYEDEDFAQVSLKHFKSYVDNPNLTLDRLNLVVMENHEILSELIPEKLKVQKLNAKYCGLQEAILPVLSHLDPDVLTELDLSVVGDVDEKIEYEELAKLDLWKNLKKLSLCKVLSPNIKAENWWNVPDIQVELVSNLTQLPSMIDHFRGSPTFQQCRITTLVGVAEIKKIIGKDLPWRLGAGLYDMLAYPASANRYPLRIVMGDGNGRIHISSRIILDP